MSAAFTPGPWTLDATRYRDGYGTRQNVLDAQGRVVLSVPSDRAFATTEANARLITAAPELYEALTELEDHSMLNREENEMARAALAKARGQ
jgi:hypothetical protein